MPLDMIEVIRLKKLHEPKTQKFNQSQQPTVGILWYLPRTEILHVEGYKKTSQHNPISSVVMVQIDTFCFGFFTNVSMTNFNTTAVLKPLSRI
jgi:hypothetical protein